MVQVFNPSPVQSNASLIGNALGTGVAKNFADPQQLVQRGMLEQALNKIPQNANYLDVLKTIGPQLLTTPGGAQLLAEMGPVLQKTSQNNAYLEYLKQNPIGANNANLKPGMGQPDVNGMPQQPQGEVKPEGEAYFNNPTPPKGKEGTYPKMSAIPEPVPMMSPDEKQQRIRQLTSLSLAAGNAPDPVAIQNTVQNEENSRIAYNQKIEEERQTREVKQQNQSARMIERFDEAYPKSSPEDKVVFEKFANQAKDAANENDAYTYARAKYRQYENAKNAIKTEANVPGFATKLFRQAMGTYKNKEKLLVDLQPHIQKFKDLGLENEARALLTDDVGLGPEDTELTMYPPSKQELSTFNKISPNPNYKQATLFGGGEKFPGVESELNPKSYIKFKDDLLSMLNENPETNLIALRGLLNFDKKYAWTDISSAVSELINEGQFKPNPIQEQQLTVIKNPPLPGFNEMFKEFWEDTR